MCQKPEQIKLINEKVYCSSGTTFSIIMSIDISDWIDCEGICSNGSTIFYIDPVLLLICQKVDILHKRLEIVSYDNENMFN